VTKTCTQCGAINKAQAHLCGFCDAPLQAAISARPSCAATPRGVERDSGRHVHGEDWKRELEHRVAVYRTRRKRLLPNANQGAFPFGATAARELATARGRAVERSPGALGRSERSARLALDETPVVHDPAEAAEEFAFAIGIGPRPHSDRDCGEPGSYRLEIDLTKPPLASDPCTDRSGQTCESQSRQQNSRAGRFGSPYSPLAFLPERAVAGCIDLFFLLFAYGGFLTLFGSLGGHFSFSKFSAAVYAATLLLFYVQYFALFTIFGGVTPGMMLRRLDLVNFDGEVPTPRQLLLRSFGYMLSGGTFLLGFFWALWDEDGLTWQDRISSTYLTNAAELLAVDTLRGQESAESTNP